MDRLEKEKAKEKAKIAAKMAAPPKLGGKQPQQARKGFMVFSGGMSTMKKVGLSRSKKAQPWDTYSVSQIDVEDVERLRSRLQDNAHTHVEKGSDEFDVLSLAGDEVSVGEKYIGLKRKMSVSRLDSSMKNLQELCRVNRQHDKAVARDKEDAENAAHMQAFEHSQGLGGGDDEND